jgi:hypothetical protein
MLIFIKSVFIAGLLVFGLAIFTALQILLFPLALFVGIAVLVWFVLKVIEEDKKNTTNDD